MSHADVLRRHLLVALGVAPVAGCIWVERPADPPVGPPIGTPDRCATAEDAAAVWRATGHLEDGEVYRLCADLPAASPACGELLAEIEAGAHPLHLLFFEAVRMGTCPGLQPPDSGALDDTGPSGPVEPCFDCWPLFAPACLPDPATDAACCVTATVDGWVCIGRPLVVDGHARTAAPAPTPGWTDAPGPLDVPPPLRAAVAEGWTRIALAEHASIASFAAFTLDLLALGAPADLVADATAAMSDEVRHAQLAFGIAAAVAGAPVGPGPLQPGPLAARDLRAALVAAVAEGCVGETLAAHEAAVAADRATSPAIRAALAAVAEDEARHAALAWRFVRWALARDPALAPAAAQALEAALARVTDDGAPDLAAWGLLGGADRRDAALRAAARVIRPCAAALLPA